MQGSSRTSFAQVRDALLERSTQSGFDQVGGELLAVSAVLSSSSALRGALTDAGRRDTERVGLVRSVLEGKVSDLTLEVVGDAASQRWSTPRDLVDAVETLGVEATLIGAERAGRADAVEDELFRINRIIAGERALRARIADPAVPDSAKADLVDSILGDSVAAETAALVRHVITHPRGRKLEQALDWLVELSATRRERLLAVVRVAAPLTSEQQERMAAALGRIYRHQVDLQIEVDPAVQGGATVQIGDEVIDGSVAHRLEQIRRRMGVSAGDTSANPRRETNRREGT
jgi:F-type H+-transporting ATPase subunit delta